MRIYRLTRREHVDSALLGLGAQRVGGRWNSPGVAMVYCAGSLELALLELLVHIDLDLIPRNLVCIELDVPDQCVSTLPVATLPPRWAVGPPYRPATQRLGDQWLRSRGSLALRVPAAVLPQRHNLLINPTHPQREQLKRIRLEQFKWPPRLARAIDTRV